MTQRLTPAQIAALARTRYNLDPQAVISVGSAEGLSGGVGDGGHAFGPFQLNDAGGVITGKFPGWTGQQKQDWAWSPQGVNYALAGISKVAGGLHGAPAVNAIVSQFERPANIPGEIARALANYGLPASAPATPPASAAAPQTPQPSPLAAAAAAPAAPKAPPGPHLGPNQLHAVLSYLLGQR